VVNSCNKQRKQRFIEESRYPVQVNKNVNCGVCVVGSAVYGGAWSAVCVAGSAV